jgi:hypothetical protein
VPSHGFPWLLLGVVDPLRKYPYAGAANAG